MIPPYNKTALPQAATCRRATGNFYAMSLLNRSLSQESTAYLDVSRICTIL